MKRGKDGEKVMGPMFPRLHVNDTEKGGPRAPPRNKMALYEQLSIPSQRFNPGLLPVRPGSNNASVPQSSSSQVSGSDRRNFFPLHTPLSNPTFLPEKLSGLRSDRSNINTSLARSGQRNKSSEEDDFIVPVFARTQEGKEKNHYIKNNGNSNTTHHHSVRTQSQHIEPEKNSTEPEDQDGEPKEGDECSHESGNNEALRNIEAANASEPKRDSPSGHTERSDNASEASILDSISVIEISPDEVVGIIGQKRFWKARRALVNQQRVFAVQIFELHRLIKVQKLIARSPHLLLEDTATTLSKPSSKSSPAPKLSAENPTNNKYQSTAMKPRDEPEKPTQPVEHTAENAVGARTPAFTNKNLPPVPPVVSGSSQWYPQPQHQAPGQQQWLIPVMSPTEGLVYKPYSGPGFSGNGFSGPYGSSPTPMMMGNFGNPVYGVPTHQGMGFLSGVPHSGHSYFPTYGMPIMSVGVSSGGSGSVSAIEPVNRPTEPTQEPSHRQQLQSSCNNNSVSVPRTAPNTARQRISKVSDLQGSTGSSPGNDRAKPTQTGSSQQPRPSNEPGRTEDGGFSERTNVFRSGDGKDELQLFPMAPETDDNAAHVIRAVPHNARSASASVARIFKSIQEERRHYDSV